MFKLFEIKEGKLSVLPTLNPKHIKGFLIVSIIAIVVTGLAGYLKLDEKDIWKIYNLLLTQLGLQHKIPDIKDNQKELDSRVEIEVDQAVRNYWREVGESQAEVYKPRYIEEKNDERLCYSDECKALAPPMRLCAPWVDSCPKD